MKKLDCIDVFSGIGGISIGLKDFVNVVQYCEIDRFCQQVLAERMADGQLDPASIHCDIKTLQLCPQLKPAMICGGFPCQDISSMGLKKGIVDGERSSLFFEIMRIVDQCPSVQVLFLENVSNIVKCGLTEVVQECHKRGFRMQWTMKSASSMGAPHVRARWFLLATRGDIDFRPLLDAAGESRLQQWGEETVPRVTLRPSAGKQDDTFDDNWILRCQTLGNAVVPAVVRKAFVELATMHAKWGMFAECLNNYGVPLDSTGATQQQQQQLHEYGLVIDGRYYSMPKAVDLEDKKHSIDIEVCFNDKPVKFKHFPTPRRGMTHASSLTERSLRDLPTVLVNSVPDYLKELGFDPATTPPHTVAIANVNYVEWLMGYAKDWTRVAGGSFKTVASRSQAVEGDDDDVEVLDGEAAGSGGRSRSRRNRARSGIGGFKYNGMHMLMKDHPGLTVSAIARLWNTLSQEDRDNYSARARLRETTLPATVATN